MARTVRVKVYKFNELNDKAKEKAIEWFLTDYPDWGWWDNVYDSFSDLCKYMHVDVDTKKIYFGQFYSQGGGSTFEAEVNAVKCIRAIQAKAWQKDFTTLAFSFPELSRNVERVVKLIESNQVNYYVKMKNSNRERSVRVETAYDFEGEYKSDLSNIEKYLDEIEEYMQDVANTLNAYLYKILQDEYEYLTSREQAIESIEANEYEFTADGKRF